VSVNQQLNFSAYPNVTVENSLPLVLFVVRFESCSGLLLTRIPR